MNYRTKAEVHTQVRCGTTRQWVLLLVLVGLTLMAPGCNLFNNLGDAWVNAEGTGGANSCSGVPMGLGGGGAGGGFGGADGAGGSGEGGGDGVGVGGAGVGAGVGGGSGDGSSGAGGSPGARHPPHRGDTVVLCDDNSPCAARCEAFAAAFGYFDPSAFKFVTIVADDGQGDAGGWQQATAALKFVPEDSPPFTCTITIGMPIRCKAFGVISPTDAATLTAAIVDQAWKAVRAASPDLPPGIFCSTFKAKVVQLFSAPMYAPLGVKVNLN